MRSLPTFLLFVSMCAYAADSPVASGVTPTSMGSVGAGEGPVSDLKGNMYFTSGDRITKRDASGQVSVFREPSGGANGLIFDKQGRLIVCES